MITALTYNIKHGTNELNNYTLDGIIGFLSKQNADLLGLQEVDRFAKRTMFEDQAQKIGDSLRLDSIFVPSLVLPSEGRDKPKREYGLMRLSRFPVIKSAQHFLRESEYAGNRFTENRICLESTIEVDGKKVAFFVAHVDTNGIEKQLEKLVGVLDRAEYPKILTGDFNVTPENPDLRAFLKEANLKNATEGKKLLTCEDERGAMQIDYIFVSKDIKVKDAKVLDVGFSDHKPLFATLSL